MNGVGLRFGDTASSRGCFGLSPRGEGLSFACGFALLEKLCAVLQMRNRHVVLAIAHVICLDQTLVGSNKGWCFCRGSSRQRHHPRGSELQVGI